jgi:hypothetical protein
MDESDDTLIAAIMVALLAPHACEAAASGYQEKGVAYVASTYCVLCQQRSRHGILKHTPNCPVTLAQRLRELRGGTGDDDG